MMSPVLTGLAAVVAAAFWSIGSSSLARGSEFDGVDPLGIDPVYEVVDEYFRVPGHHDVAFGVPGRELLHGCHYGRCASTLPTAASLQYSCFC